MVCPRIKNAILAKKLSNARLLPFSHGGKRKQNAAGVPPDPRGSCRFSLQENLPAVIIKTNDKKRGCGPGDWGLCAFSVPRPTGPRGPLGSLFIRVGFGSMVRVDFPEKKIDKATRGVQGALPPDVSLHPFFTWRKDVPARHECIKNHALLNGSGLRATHFWPEPQK